MVASLQEMKIAVDFMDGFYIQAKKVRHQDEESFKKVEEMRNKLKDKYTKKMWEYIKTITK